MRPACVLDRLNSVRIAMIAVLTFWRAMYEMKYIAHSSASTFVVAEMPEGRSAIAGGWVMGSRARAGIGCADNITRRHSS
jgi:hypothetical protein